MSQFLIYRPDKTYYNGGVSKVNEAHVKPDPRGTQWLDEDIWKALLRDHSPRHSNDGSGTESPANTG